MLQVRYDVKSDAVIYGCTSYLAGSPSDNTTMATDNCVINYRGNYANDMCEYCCLGNLCNRDMTSSWLKTDCSRLRSSAATITVATVAIATTTMMLLIGLIV